MSSRTLDDLLGDIEGDTVPLEVALGAYAVAIGSLPGVETPAQGEVALRSGTGPSRWVRAHWDELTPEQRSAIEGYEGDPVQALGVRWRPMVATAPLMGLVAADDGVDELAMVILIDDISNRIAAKIGRPLGIPVELMIAPELVDGTAVARATPIGSGGPWIGTPTKCLYEVTKAGLPESKQIDANGVASAALESTIAHELWHCFTFTVGDPSRIPFRSAWVEEGMAEWVGQEISGGSEPNWWGHWLLKSSDLYQRTYDANGFWAHVAENSPGLWAGGLDITAANDAGNDAAYQATVAIADPSMLTTWGPGYFRDPVHALEWDQDGAGIPPIKSSPLDFGALADGGAMVLSANPRSHTINLLDLTAEVAIVSPTTYGMMQLPDGVNLSYPGNPVELLCTKLDGCTCPEDSPAAAAVFRQTIPGMARVGLTGHTSGAEMSLTGWSLPDFCDQPPVPDCMVGSWSSEEYRAPDQVALAGMGTMQVTIDRAGTGLVEFDPDIALVARLTDPNAPFVRMVFDGSYAFALTHNATVATLGAGNGTLNFYAYLNGAWVPGVPEPLVNGFGTELGSSFQCVGDQLLIRSPSGAEWNYSRMDP